MVHQATIALALLALLTGAAGAQATVGAPSQPADSAAKAAASFAEGQRFYRQGKYAEAIAAFERAHAAAPHPSAQFNIARCYENLAKTAKALEHYHLALEAARKQDPRGQDPATAADIRQRIARLKSLPVKVFISSQPDGAEITIGGRAAAERGRTPMVVQLSPGSHVLLARLAGHELAAKRVVVALGKPTPLVIKLAPRRLPRDEPCVDRDRLDLDALHIHGRMLGAIGLALGRPLLPAPGVRMYAMFHRFVFGGHLLYFPVGEESIKPITVQDETFTNAKFRSVLVQAEGGYALPLSGAHVELTAGLGISVDRVAFATEASSAELVREQTAFAWSVGGTLQAPVWRWLLVGISARFGLIHGDRVAKDDPNATDDQHHIPYATFWGSLSLRL